MQYSMKHLPVRWLVATALLLGLLAGCQSTPPSPSKENQAAIDRMLVLVDERLEVASQVARSKWNSGADIEAPEREAAILDRVTGRSAEAGVDESFARDFFQAQFEASKEVQRRLHQRWLKEGREPFDNPPDLAEEVRPVLDRLTPALIESLGELQSLVEVPGVGSYLEARATELVTGDFDGVPRRIALEPLKDR
ncbi:gamma subclass chorismate mutase AroQ [Halomonas sp. PAR8]|uniref:gamma subclass chorismate mutase AroQ n=1 Tax=Halomonas sp. PAR8 TaxID=3075515 RepID=UPI0028852D55|nr:gamma subclass chorismate mutase AroQ [Halomonas sp. PAR8]MDT0591782.1 gamma subclass chorismate mutase AroQ [Halomonas sp. PAR8]